METTQKGMALVIVIWILSLLSLMAGSFALTMRRESSIAMALKNNAQASALAESGLGLAQFMLQYPDPKRRWRPDGTVYQVLRADGGETRFRVVSESGKIDINTSDEAQLSAVIKTITKDAFEQQHLLNCLLDWRDEDDQVRMHGAERKQYKAAGLPYGPSNKPFQTLEELQRVMGFDEAIYSRIEPLITVYSGQKEVNLRVATPEVLRVISADLQDRNISDEYVKQRLAGENGRGPSDQSEQEDVNNANQTYTVTVEVQMEGGASAALEAVIKMQSEDPSQPQLQVFDWRSNQLTQSLFSSDMESELITVEDEFTNNN
ncbi:MAG: general secretion pathway protein GspK [Methylomonas sp.]